MNDLETPGGPALSVRPGLVEPDASPAPSLRPNLFRVIWRWHFYAGILVAPVLITMAVTGGIYLFGAELHDVWNRSVLFVSPGTHRVPFSEQVRRAAEVFPDQRVESVEVAADARRSTVITLKSDEEGSPPRVFVDPYTGTVLGSATSDPIATFMDVVLQLHRELLVGTSGRIVTELVTSWSVVLLITGLCLWWPRTAGKVRGVWLPRWPAKSYTLLRDVHAISGMYLLPVLLLIAVTGLFYAILWGESFHFVSSQWTKSNAPSIESKDQPTETEEEPAEHVAPPSVSIDQAVETASKEFPGRNLHITFPGRRQAGYSLSAMNDYARGTYGAMQSTSFAINAETGAVESVQDLASDDRYWWHCWTYPLHVGSIFGPASKIIWLIACCVLAGLPATGLWMWWQRRPPGRSGFPRKPEVSVPLWLAGMIATVCVLLPTMGLSVLLILLIDATVGRLWKRRRVHRVAG